MTSPEPNPPRVHGFRQRLGSFMFDRSIRAGRWFAAVMPCFFAKSDHKPARFIARFTSGILPGHFSGLQFAVTTIAGVPCRIYRPKMAEPSTNQPTVKVKLPVIVFIHGGGWTIGSARSYQDFTAKLCRDTGCIVVSVDYSLAPERPYPHGYEDCLAVVRCLLNADSIATTPFLSGRVDTSRIVVAGDSAGGNLSACVALDLIRAGDRRLRALVLLSPVTQALNFSLPSYQKYAPKYALDWFVAHYAGVKPSDAVLIAMRNGEHLDVAGRQLRRRFVEPKDEQGRALSAVPLTEKTQKAKVVPSRLAELCANVSAWPLLADDAHLAQLPPTFLQSCQLDPLLDENELFAKRLKAVALPHFEYASVPDSIHDASVMSHLLKTQESRDGYEQIVSFIVKVVS